MQRFIDAFLNFFRDWVGLPRRFHLHAKLGRFTAPLAIALMLGTMPAQAQQACDPWSKIADYAGQQGLPVVKLTDAQAKKIEDDFNAIPPASNEKFDSVYVVKLRDRTNLVVLVNKGCVQGSGQFDAEGLAKLIGEPGRAI
jgi:hypothetical protein